MTTAATERALQARGRTLLARCFRAERRFAAERGDRLSPAFQEAWEDHIVARLALTEHLARGEEEVAGRALLARLNAVGRAEIVVLKGPRRTRPCRHTRWRSRGYSR